MEAAAEEPGPTRGSLLGTSHNHNVGERAHEVEDRSQIVETYRAETKWMESEHMWDRSAESEDAAEESPSDSSQTETESESDDSDDQSDDSDDESDESDDERRYGLADWNVFEKKAVASPLTGSIKSWSQGLLVHANKRLIELIIDARKALHTSRWSALWRSIQELVKWLNRAQLRERLKSLGLLLPILSRLFQDLDHLVIREPTMNSKVYRQRLERDEAKALSVMQQKWPKLWTQEMNLNFLDIIQRYSVDKPRTIAGVDDLPTRTILDCLERILLRLSHRFALSDMRLIQIPAALLDLEAIVAWYLLFGPIFSSSSSSGPFSSLLSDPTKEVLLEIKFLDLSGNELTEIHPKLPSVLPGLQKLTLSGNPLGCLPASSCQWVWLTTVSRPCQPSMTTGAHSQCVFAAHSLGDAPATAAAASAGPPKKPYIFPAASFTSSVGLAAASPSSWVLLSSAPPAFLFITLPVPPIILTLESTSVDSIETT
ncbi:hypothetical protein PCASD_22677 [Puccinia coronata f. sp. avenae]|uniref:Uncharacterized protein n=1 Tax=Puccinia coronata f. sp. avenae TaxID=200324 RepID=A0A2N5TJX3_9BASI|nr:hypothetical protein PCASD_22677 [Puccinia coronata f. sp. avenae]